MTRDEILTKVRELEEKIMFEDRCLRVFVCPECGCNILALPNYISKYQCQSCQKIFDTNK